MSLGTPSPAPVLDAGNIAGQQQNYNVGAQASSNYNQTNPYGSLSYQQTGTSPSGTPIYTANTQLSAPQQGLFNTLQGTQQTAGTQASNLLSGANYGGQSPTTAIGDLTSGLTSQVMGQAVAGMTPYYGQQVSQLDTQLRNQGFKPGDPAYNQAMNGLQQNQNQSVSGFEAQFEPSAFSQATNLYTLPENMALQEASFGQPGSVVQNLAPTNALQPANYQGAASTEQQAYEQQYQQQSANQNAMLSGLFGIGSNALGGLAKGYAGSAGGSAAITAAMAAL